MLRAVALAARLDFTIDPPLADAIRKHRGAIATSSPPRLIEEYYKILRTGAAERAFRALYEIGLLEPLSAELHHKAGPQLWESLARLDAYRNTFDSTPDTLTNPVILGSLIVPLGLPLRGEQPQEEGPTGSGEASAHRRPRKPPALKLGELPLARGDVEGLRQALMLQRRLRDLGAHPRAQRSLVHRGVFPVALTWLEIHGLAPALIEHWQGVLADVASEAPDPPDGDAAADSAGNVGPPHTGGEPPFGVRKRRRRRRRRRPPTA